MKKNKAIIKLEKVAMKAVKFLKKPSLQKNTVVLPTVAAVIVLSGLATYVVVNVRSNNTVSGRPAMQTHDAKHAALNTTNTPLASQEKANADTGAGDGKKSDNPKTQGPGSPGSSKTSPQSITPAATTAGGNTQTVVSPAAEPYPVYSFYAAKGSVTKTYQSDTITYTFTITIVPTYAKFGDPTIVAFLPTGTKNYTCHNRGQNVTQRYSAGNSLTIQCIVTRVYPSHPPDYIAPLPSGTVIEISVYGALDSGELTNGNMLEYPMDAGYDR